jgi:COP9 signalosome complex subunit 1
VRYIHFDNMALIVRQRHPLLGHTKVSRACFIAERCPALEVEAYKIALVETQTNSLDTQKYEHIITRLNAALKARNEPELPVDKEWIQTTQKQAKATAEKLEAELRNYKNNMIKESIRVSICFIGFCNTSNADL